MWDSDSKIIAIGQGIDRVMLAWDPITGQKLTDVGNLDHVRRCVFTVAGRQINFERDSVDAYQILAQIRSGIPDELRILRTYAEGQNSKYAVSRDGRLVAKNDNQVVRVCDVATGREMRVLVGHADFVTCMTWSKDGEHLVSCGPDSTLRVWTSGARVRIVCVYTWRMCICICICVYGTCIPRKVLP